MQVYLSHLKFTKNVQLHSLAKYGVNFSHAPMNFIEGEVSPPMPSFQLFIFVLQPILMARSCSRAMPLNTVTVCGCVVLACVTCVMVYVCVCMAALISSSHTRYRGSFSYLFLCSFTSTTDNVIDLKKNTMIDIQFIYSLSRPSEQ